MAVKPIVEVEVNSEQFKAFTALFAKYQESLKAMPAAWKKTDEAVKKTEAAVSETSDGVEEISEHIVNQNDLLDKQTEVHKEISETVAGTSTDFMTMTAALLAQNELLHKQTLAHIGIERAARKTGNSFDNMIKSTKKVFDNITGITSSLLKWSSITGVIGGLMGFGGLFGYEALARSASGARTSAMGLGVSPGQLQAANLVYGNKLGDAGGILSRLADTQGDVGKSAKMSAILGIPRADINTKNPAELLPEMLEALQRRLKNIPSNQLGTMAGALGLTDYASMSDLRILRGMSPKELHDMGKLAPKTAQDVGGSLETDRKYQDFLTKLGTATQKSENALIDALAPLAGPLGDIIKAFSDDLGVMFKNPAVKKGMEDFASWLSTIPDTLGKPETKKAFSDFIDGVVGVAKALSAFVKWFAGKDEKPLTPQQQKEIDQAPFLWPGAFHPDGSNDNAPHLMNASYHPGGPMGNSFHASTDYTGRFGNLEQQYGLPAGLLQSTMMAESGGDNNSVSSAGAVGAFQFMPGTAQRFGLNNPRDTMQSATAAAKYFASLLQMFNGNVEQAVAGYNWGEGNVLNDIKQHGSDWKRYLPHETSNYVPEVVGGMSHGTVPAAPSGVNLHIYNQTGGSVVASASAMGAIPA